MRDASLQEGNLVLELGFSDLFQLEFVCFVVCISSIAVSDHCLKCHTLYTNVDYTLNHIFMVIRYLFFI